MLGVSGDSEKILCQRSLSLLYVRQVCSFRLRLFSFTRLFKCACLGLVIRVCVCVGILLFARLKILLLPRLLHLNMPLYFNFSNCSYLCSIFSHGFSSVLSTCRRTSATCVTENRHVLSSSIAVHSSLFFKC